MISKCELLLKLVGGGERIKMLKMLHKKKSVNLGNLCLKVNLKNAIEEEEEEHVMAQFKVWILPTVSLASGHYPCIH